MMNAIVEIAIYATAIGALAVAYFIFEWARFIGGTMLEEMKARR